MQRFPSRLALLVALLVCGRLPAVELHVARDGRDSNPGTVAAPFATLERARGAAREAVSRREPVQVILHAGIYPRSETFVLSAEDSGVDGVPVVYRSAAGEKAILVGAIQVPPAWLVSVTDQDPLWLRLDPAARAHIRVVALREHGVTQYGRLVPRADSPALALTGFLRIPFEQIGPGHQRRKVVR